MRKSLSLVGAALTVLVACGGSKFTAASGDGGGDDGGSSADGGTSGDGGTNGDAGSDASGDGGLGLDGGVGSCQGSPSIFNDIIKGCTVSAGCVVAFHQLDCCGSLMAVGINHASVNAFDADEAKWRMSCPACGCAARETVSEDGRMSNNQSDFRAECVNNVCRSYLP